MRALLSITLLAVVASAIGGCGATGDAETAGSPDRLPVGQEFLSTQVSEAGKPRPLVGDTRIRLSFGEGKLTIDAGCNSLFGDARLADGTLVVENIGGTEMGCSQPLMKQDEWVTEFFGSGPRWQHAGDTLTLTSGDTSITLLARQAVEPDRSLLGTRWQLDTVIDGATASSVPAGVEARLRFGQDGSVTGSGGCNQLSARFERDGDRITFSQVITTRMLCPGDRSRVERTVLAVLESAPRAEIEAGRLTLTSDSGQGLGFTASER